MPQAEKVEHGEHIILIDGYNFVYRAFHALPAMNRPDGTNVGAVYGFTSMLMRLLLDMQASHAVVVFDTAARSFRRDIYPEYKAHRPPVPPELIPQFKLVREAADALNLCVIEKDGFEADDVIATITRMAKEAGEAVTIVSTDKDLMQLIDDQVRMYDPIKSKPITEKEVLEKFGVKPDRVLDVLTLMGDASDNIPGVPGIGPKTAAELINQFDNIDELVLKINEITQIKRKQTLQDNIENIELSRKLLTLDKNVNLGITLSDLSVKESNPVKIYNFIEQQGFKSLNTKAKQFLALKAPNTVVIEEKFEFKQITTLAQLIEFLKSSSATGKLGFYLHNNSKTNINRLEFATSSQDIAFIDVSLEANLSNPNQQRSFSFEQETPKGNLLSLVQIINAISDILSDSSILKITHDLKSFQKILNKCGASPTNIISCDDVMLMSYSANNGLIDHDITSLLHNVLNEGELIIKGLIDIHPLLQQQMLQKHVETIYHKIELPLTDVLLRMEGYGVKIDQNYLYKLSQEFEVRLNILEQEIYTEAKCQFNIGSPKQIAEVLFERMGLAHGKISSKSGAYSTSADILEELHEQGYKIASDILIWRQLSKLKNTYTDALPTQINSTTGRVHTNFSMAGTSTGRLSSSEPNLQNIPIRSEEGNKIRSAFIAEKNLKLLSADYSQIELRLLAHIANITSLQQAFAEKKDIHSITASQVLNIPLEQVDSQARRKAKEINFGIIYGISAFGLAKRLFIPVHEAKSYITRYFAEYPGIQQYMEETKEFARNHGYVHTLFGRRCYLKSLNNGNSAAKGFAERAAINAPIQGTAADIIKKAMIHLDEAIIKQKMKSRMILQVHDELIFEAPEDEIEALSALVKDKMESVIKLNVPLIVDIGIGDNWASLHY